MALTVLNVAYPFAEVSLDAAGGAEQIVAILDEGLLALGHRSIVVAREGSKTFGKLVPISYPHGPLDDDLRSLVHVRYRELIEETIRDHAPDVIHMHGVDAHSYLPSEGPPVLVTMHLPPSFYPEGAFRDVKRPQTFVNCVSLSQRRSCPELPGMLDVVPNGIRIGDYEPSPVHDGFFLALGRICPEKGFHLALDAARLADAEMILAGQVFPYEDHERYFQREILPRLDEKRRFIGPVNLREKRALLGRARGVVIASTVEETSSLVAMEALASGSPVIAHRIGALPEVVEDGKTGFLVENLEEMAAALSRIDDIDRSFCRRRAELHFSSGPMVSRYIEHYERLLRMGGRP